MDFWACYWLLYQREEMAPIISYPWSQWTLQCIFSKIEKAVQLHYVLYNCRSASILAAVVFSPGQHSWDLRKNKNGKQNLLVFSYQMISRRNVPGM